MKFQGMSLDILGGPSVGHSNERLRQPSEWIDAVHFGC